MIYKPAVIKYVGDLQWYILHGIIAMTAFVSILNPVVSDQCAFCEVGKNIFHFFSTMFRIIESFGECFTRQVFVFGFSYGKRKKDDC